MQFFTRFLYMSELFPELLEYTIVHANNSGEHHEQLTQPLDSDTIVTLIKNVLRLAFNSGLRI